MDKRLGEVQLREISEQIGSEWKTLATYLVISRHEVYGIEQDHPSLEERVFTMLCKWRERQRNDECIVNDLAEALLKSKRADLAALLQERTLPVPTSGPAESEESFDVNTCRAELIRYYTDTIGKVQLLPWFDEDTTDINEIFVSPELNEIKNMPSGKMPIKLSSYGDTVALKADNGQRKCRVLVRGQAGSGKSTLVSKITYDWASSRTLSNYQLVFALSLREVQKHQSLVDIIFDQILPKDTIISKNQLEKFVRYNAEKVLILLDGYDEYPLAHNLNQAEAGDVIDILCAEKLRESCVLVTTRPHKVEDFGRFHRRYVQVELQGFTNESTNTYIDKFFLDSPERGETLKSQLDRSESLRNLSKVPIMVLMLCLLWNDSQSLPERMTDLFIETFHYFVKRSQEKEGIESGDSDEDIRKTVKAFIQDLGCTALKGLLESDRKLLFESHDFPPGVVDKACKVGLMMQERTRSKLSVKRIVNFFHKTFQEFCAGSYLAALAEINEQEFLAYLNQIKQEDLDEMEYLLRFCCGQNKAAAKLVLPRVAKVRGEICDKNITNIDSIDYHVGIERKHRGRQPWMLPVILLQESQEQSFLCSIQPAFQSSLPHFFMSSIDPESARTLQYLLESNLSSVRSETCKDKRKVKSVFKNVQQLQLSSNHFGDLVMISSMIEGIPHLVSLKLELCLFDYDSQGHETVFKYANLLSTAIGTLESLQTLVLTSPLHMWDLTAVFKSLCCSETPCTTIVRLSVLGITFDIPTMTQFLKTQPNMRTLHLANNCLKTADMEQIFSSVRNNRSLEHLKIMQNEVSKSLKCLQDIASQLKSLQLNSASLLAEHSPILSDILQEADRLEYLNLSDNSVDVELGNVLGQLPSGSLSSLKDLTISQGEGFLQAISSSVAGLQKLNLSGFRVGPANGQLAQLLKNKKQLSVLNLTKTNLSDPDFVELAESFPQISALTELSLVDNTPGVEGLEALFHGFLHLPALKLVEMSRVPVIEVSINSNQPRPLLMNCLERLPNPFPVRKMWEQRISMADAQRSPVTAFLPFANQLHTPTIEAIKAVVRESSQ